MSKRNVILSRRTYNFLIAASEVSGKHPDEFIREACASVLIEHLTRMDDDDYEGDSYEPCGSD